MTKSEFLIDNDVEYKFVKVMILNRALANIMVIFNCMHIWFNSIKLGTVDLTKFE